MAIVTDTVAVQRFAMGLFGVQVGTVTMAQVDKQIDRTSLSATLNSFFTSGFGAQTTAAVAATLVANLGITGAGVAGAVAYVTAKLNAAAPAARGEEINKILNDFSGMTADATYGAAAQAWNANLEVAAGYTGTANVAFGSVIAQSLTKGLDTLFGSALADMFTADADALQNGDNISGGAGNDTLKALLTNTGNAVTAITSSVENVVLTSQNSNYNSGDNNISSARGNNVDAARMSGVNNWENSNSRADLIVEDVRIADNQITKDITITMRETDPGHVDFAVYFDQNSLRNSSASTSQINLQVMDTRAVVDGKAPLLNSPYGGFKFTATDAKGVANVVTLQSDAIDAAQTYAELAAAFQAAADKQFGAGVVTVSVGSDFSVTDTTTAKTVTGKEVIIKTSSAFSFTTPTGSGWVAAGVVPANSGLHTNFSQGSTKNTDPVTSTIVLDDVGRGSTGGDLVVGGLSVGETSTSKGVQRFNITVEDNSKLETINSTNNTLREVSIVNGTTSRVDNAYNDNVKDAGNLTVTGTVQGPVTDYDNNGQNNLLPGLKPVEHGDYGFTDVRLIDASTFKGKLDLNAQLTDRVTTKYMTLTDAPAAAAADNVSFDYLMGTNNDTFALKISEANLAYAGTTTREDFVLNIAGNAGNDKLTATIAKDNVTGDAAGWYANSKLNANLNINGGEGDDTITTKLAGDWKVVGGAGNDVIYDNVDGSENTFWLLNGKHGSGTNIDSGKNDKNFFAGVEVSVTFKHITKTVKVSSTDGFTSDLQINQAIKDAVNNDATLKALLVAKDGPANSLIVESLVDGAVANDFNVEFARTSTLSEADAATIGAAYRAAYLAMGINPNAIIPATSITAAQVIAVMDKHINDLGATIGSSSTADIDFGSELGDYTGYYKEEAKADGNQGDSTFNLGTGNDILALDVNMNSSDKVVYNAGELFGADTVVNFGTIVSATALETAAKAAETAAKEAETAAKELAAATPTDTALAAAATAATAAAKAATAAANAATAAAMDATKSLTDRAAVDKFDFTAIGGDMMASATINFVPGSTGGSAAYNFVNMSTAQADRDLVDAGYDYNAGTFATVTTPASLNTAAYFDAPTTGTNMNVIAASAADLAIARKDKSIVIVNLDEVFGTEGSINNTAAEVALYVEGGVVETTISTHVVVVVDKHNVGSVYSVVDGTAANDAVATLMGTIDLGSTLWSDLTAENFV